MKLENDFTVPVPVDDAWGVLLDVERVAPCMPGATLDEVDGDTFSGRVRVKVGPIQVTYRGTARFVERDEDARRAVIEASGRESRGSGTAKATITTTLHSDGDGTKVQVVTDLSVTGKPAQFGRGVMADVSGKLIQQFADCLAEEVRAGAAAEAAATAAAPAAGAGEAEAPTESAGGPTVPAPPLPPTGAPQEPAPAPATPLAAAGVGGQATSAAAAGPRPATATTTSATPGPRPQRRTPEAIDLLDTAGAPVLKRLAPVAGVALLVALVLWLLRRRR